MAHSVSILSAMLYALCAMLYALCSSNTINTKILKLIKIYYNKIRISIFINYAARARLSRPFSFCR